MKRRQFQRGKAVNASLSVGTFLWGFRKRNSSKGRNECVFVWMCVCVCLFIESRATAEILYVQQRRVGVNMDEAVLALRQLWKSLTWKSRMPEGLFQTII